MYVIGICGYSGAGKTTLVERLVRELHGRVSVVKHAHHGFDIDHPGQDSWRHREAGAYEVVIASAQRLAKIREFAVPATPSVHAVLAELAVCDWALVEGWKQAALPKLEVWRAAAGHPALYPDDPQILAICTPHGDSLPTPTALPVLDLDDAAAVADFLRAHTARLVYTPPG